jgi:hypothetical protein
MVALGGQDARGTFDQLEVFMARWRSIEASATSRARSSTSRRGPRSDALPEYRDDQFPEPKK